MRCVYATINSRRYSTGRCPTELWTDESGKGYEIRVTSSVTQLLQLPDTCAAACFASKNIQSDRISGAETKQHGVRIGLRGDDALAELESGSFRHASSGGRAWACLYCHEKEVRHKSSGKLSNKRIALRFYENEAIARCAAHLCAYFRDR
jgi:hypothetical protein